MKQSRSWFLAVLEDGEMIQVRERVATAIEA